MEEQITVVELGLLLLVFGGPVYIVATIALLGASRRARRIGTLPHSAAGLVVRAWLLALPLTLVVWWAMGLLPDPWLDFVVPSASWLPLGIIVLVPATVASLLAFGATGWWARRRATRPAG